MPNQSEKNLYKQVIDSLKNIRYPTLLLQENLSKLQAIFYQYYRQNKSLPTYVKQADLLKLAKNSMPSLSILAINPKIVERMMGDKPEEKAKWIVFHTVLQAKANHTPDEEEFLTRIKTYQRKIEFALHARQLKVIAKKIDNCQQAILEKLYHCKKNVGAIKLCEQRANLIKTALSDQGISFSERLNKFLSMHQKAGSLLHDFEVAYESERESANKKIVQSKMKTLGFAFYEEHREILIWLAHAYQAAHLLEKGADKFVKLFIPDENLLTNVSNAQLLAEEFRRRGERKDLAEIEKNMSQVQEPYQYLQAELLSFAASVYVENGHAKKRKALEKLAQLDPTAPLDPATRAFYKHVLIFHMRKYMKFVYKPRLNSAKAEIKKIELNMHAFLHDWVNKIERLVSQPFIEQRIFNQGEWQNDVVEEPAENGHKSSKWTTLRRRAMSPATYLHELLDQTTKMKGEIERRFDSKEFNGSHGGAKPMH